MGATLDRLWSVQQLQSELYSFCSRRDGEQDRLLSRARKIDELRRGLAARRDELLRKQADYKGGELEAKALQEQVSALRVKLNMTRNNKEYQALLSEIATVESRCEMLIARGYKLDEDAKNLQKVVADLEAGVAAQEAEHRATEEASRKRILELNAKIAALEAKRKEQLAGFPADIRIDFEKHSERFEGQAMAEMEPLEGTDGEFFCAGCNMQLTAGVSSAVLYRDEVRHCPTCTKILYYVG